VHLQGKVCLVTGGTGGIGTATVQELAARGAMVVVASKRRTTEIICTCQKVVETHEANIGFMQLDVADSQACRNCIDRIIKDFGRIDVLVHLAGGLIPGGILEVTEEAWMNAFAVHVHSAFHLVQSAVPHMTKQGEGSIVLISSAAGIRGCLGAIAYGVAKGALPQFARSLARELAELNIRVNCVSPGIIRTPFQDFLNPEQVNNNVANRIPLHREGKPGDVAALIITLLENDFVTGENFVIDGGMTMRMV
jgi:NAD(P)-dependent dehydrogenase (short-subunit alcohol dehydrogenase family)